MYALRRWPSSAAVRRGGSCLTPYSSCSVHGARQFHRLSVEAAAVDQARLEENQKLCAKLGELNKWAGAGGGADAIKRHKLQHRKLLADERLQLLLDKDAPFVEVGKLVGSADGLPRGGSIIGIGSVSGRLCVINATDGTVKGGTVYPVGVKKQLRGQYLSETLALPSIYVIDSGGAFLPLQADIFPDKNHGGRTFRNQAVLGAKGITQIAVVVGSCTAGGAYVPTMSDEAVIVDKIGSVFLGGPPLVKAALGENVSTEQLGGATLHCRDSGCTDYFAKTEPEAFEYCRQIVSTLKASNCAQNSADQKTVQSPAYPEDDLINLAGSVDPSPAFVYQLLSRVLDGSEFLEFRQMYGEGLICGYGKVDGRTIGVVAAVGTGVDAKSALKACQLVQMCEDRGIPLAFFQRCLHDGWSQYDAHTIKPHAQLMQAIATSRVHKVVVNVGGAFGADYFLTCGRSFDPTFYFAWPNAVISHSREDEKPESALSAASRLIVDDVIFPQDTRKVLQQVIPLLFRSARSPNEQGSCRLMRL
uniref:methylcrotonoyl-CoA carboxylase n=1 Tax=Plectus sambesii TaxID=2011161 RepID=A0A914W6I7_9BILA